MKERPMALPCSLFKHSPLEVAEGLREPNTARKRNTNEKMENLFSGINSNFQKIEKGKRQ